MSETMTAPHAPIRSEVLATPEGFCLRDDDGELRPIRLGGAPVREFLPGWAPLFVYSAFPGLHLLELQHESRQRATWFLDDRLERLGDAVKDLPPHHQARLIEAAGALRADLWVQLMLAARPALSQATRAFFHLNEPIREQIFAALQQANPAEPTVIDLAAHTEPTLSCSWNGGEAVLRREHLEALFAAPITDRFIEACATGRLTWPSPVDGAPMRHLGGLFLDDFRFAYRMLDEATGLVVVPIVTEHCAWTIAVFLPQAGLAFTPSGLAAHLLSVHFRGLARTLERHLWEFSLLLERYFGLESYSFASVFRGRPGLHLGHQLWNELSPIETITAALPPAKLPLFLVPNASEGIEIYGPLDTLFPELAGRVVRSEQGVQGLIPDAYARRYCVTRMTGNNVPAGLRDRIVRFASNSPAGLAAEAAAASAGRRPIITIGLRVENRTHVNLTSFLKDLIGRLVQRLGCAIFVIDGHNRRLSDDPESSFESHWEHVAVRRPQDVEREIVAELTEYFADSPAQIVSTVGSTIQASISWSRLSRVFIAIWGAGLAKYRWVTNTPGYVVSSAWNLRERSDLHIYDLPQYTEAPTEIAFVNPDIVTDCLNELPILIVGDRLQPSYANFDVSVEALWPDLEQFLARHAL